MKKDYSIETLCVQAGWTPTTGEPRVLPIYQSTTFKYDTSDAMGRLFDLEDSGYFYTRLQNPTNDCVADKICQLEGGVAAMQTINALKAKILYDAIDNSGGFYTNKIAPKARSQMNVIFHTPSKELDLLFAQESTTRGLRLLKGYQSMGGMRASIYNAMPLQGVEALIDFMSEFQKRYG